MRGLLRLFLALLVLAGLAAGGWHWWQQQQSRLPPGIAFGNGRIEAGEIDIATKYAGRIASLSVDEGDMVKQGQVLARMDTQDKEAELSRAEAQQQQASNALDQSHATLAMRQSELTLAQSEYQRYRTLLEKGNTTRQEFDRRLQVLQAATAALNAGDAAISAATHALEAANADVHLIQVQIADNTLVAPRDGRIQYRLADVGEVLPAGGKIFTMLDTADVYMNIYLPTEQAGRVAVGADARILLDAYPNFPVQARASFVASEAQFTPKMVETQSERDKLMFRVKLKVDAALLRAHVAEVRTGLPGIGYVLMDPAATWPAQLTLRAPP